MTTRTAAGSPITVEVFEGSTTDPLTVANQVAKLGERFGLQQVVPVGGRGMLTAARIRISWGYHITEVLSRHP